MKLMLVVGLTLLLVSMTSVSGQARKDERAGDAETIRKVLATYVDTWNRHDMDAWGALFTHDVDYVNRAGGWWKSNKENVEGHRMIHEILMKQNQTMNFRATVAKIAFLEPKIAVVQVMTEWPGFTTQSPDNSRGLSGIITMVMVKQNGVWLIRALHNTIITKPKQGESRKT